MVAERLAQAEDSRGKNCFQHLTAKVFAPSLPPRMPPPLSSSLPHLSASASCLRGRSSRYHTHRGYQLRPQGKLTATKQPQPVVKRRSMYRKAVPRRRRAQRPPPPPRGRSRSCKRRRKRAALAVPAWNLKAVGWDCLNAEERMDARKLDLDSRTTDSAYIQRLRQVYL